MLDSRCQSIPPPHFQASSAVTGKQFHPFQYHQMAFRDQSQTIWTSLEQSAEHLKDLGGIDFF